MNPSAVSHHIQNLMQQIDPVYKFVTDSAHARRIGDPTLLDFVYGNPHEMPLAEYTQALVRWVEPKNKDWFAYTNNDPAAQKIVARTLQRTHGLPFRAEDISMTSGSFGALAAAMGALIDPWDEVIFISPPWFFYESMITKHYGVPIRVKCDPHTYDLDLKAIEAAISPRTRAIIVNSPNNPTGRIYPEASLKALADLLAQASQNNGRPVYILSDELYNRILFDGRKFYSPAAYYPYTLLIYTYGKTLLAPGQRIGYIALPPSMPDRELVNGSIFVSQLTGGWLFPNALLQHALPDLEELSIDIPHLQARRDRVVGSLREMGYELTNPEGTFYILVRSPLEDDMAFINLLAEENIYCLPGVVFEMPGYFRISLTANDQMVEKALPGFEKALQAARVRT